MVGMFILSFGYLGREFLFVVIVVMLVILQGTRINDKHQQLHV